MTTTRRSFIAASASVGALNILPGKTVRAGTDAAVIGHNDFRYRVNKNWSLADAAQFPVNDCHEMVEDSQGRLFLFQTNVKNNILIYDKSGKLLGSWGNDYPGAHGMDLVNENGEEFLFLVDTRGFVYKTDLNGRLIFKLERPDSDKYPTDPDPAKQPKYAPTNVMPAPDGTFFIGDGYGSYHILHYSHEGKLLNVFGGKGPEPHHLNNPHGGMVDTTDPTNPILLICSRGEQAIKKLAFDGSHLATVPLPGLRVCQIRKHGSHYYIPSLNGVVSVLNQDLQLLSSPGGTPPREDQDGHAAPTTQVDIHDQPLPPPVKAKPGEPEPPAPQTVFIHPHSIWIDDKEDLYIPQWNSGKTYPIKLERIS